VGVVAAGLVVAAALNAAAPRAAAQETQPAPPHEQPASNPLQPLLALAPEARAEALAALDRGARRALWALVNGDSGVTPAEELELMAEILLSVPAEARIEELFGATDPDACAIAVASNASVIDAYAAAMGVPLERRLRLLEALRDGLEPENYGWIQAEVSRVGALFGAGEFTRAIEEVGSIEARLSAESKEPPRCTPRGPTEDHLQRIREAYLELIALRALVAANLGFGDEQVEPLRGAVEQLEAMRREYEAGRTITYNRAFHVYVASALASVYVLLERFAPAERLLEETLSEAQLFESFEAGQRTKGLDRRDDLEAELLLSLALARIGRGMSDQASDCADVLERASVDLNRLIELAVSSSAPTRYPVPPNLAPRARLWLAWIELERAPERAAPWLEQVESIGESLDRSERRFLWVLEARSLRLRARDGDLEARRELLDRAVDDFSAQWAAVPPRAEGLGPMRDLVNWELVGELLRLEEDTLEPRDAVLAAVERFEGMLALGSQPRLLGSEGQDHREALDHLLGPDRGILYVFPTGFGPARVALLAEGTVTLGATAPVGRIAELDEGALGLLGRPPEQRGSGGEAQLESYLVALRDTLLTPAIQEHLAGLERVAAVGFELLTRVPLSALPAGEGRWIGTEVGVVELPSLTVAGVLTRRSLAADPRTLTLITNPGTAASVGLTEAQLGALGRAFDEFELWTGPRAAHGTLADHFRTATKPCDVLAFVVHGGRAADTVRSAGLQLTPGEGDARGGLLLAGAVEELDLSGVGLVALASCRAGGERSRLGDAGSASLGGAFLRAGAAATLDARGELPVTATVELLSAFFEAWNEGAPADVALQLARRRIAADPATGDPFFHAQLRFVAAPTR
jgi:hypothetical protein